MRALTLLPLIVLTTGCSVFGVNYNTEEPSYRVLEADNDFEVRLYDSMVVAATTVNGSFDSAGNRAFGALFGYISGENVTNSKIAMTAPVIADQAGAAEGRKIPMTAPVLRESNDQGWRYLFVLPEEFSLENAPAPLNEQVKLTAEPAKKIAVLRYSGSMDEQKLEQKVSQLQQWIADNQLVAVSQPRWAGYNPPWTLPFLRRNEVMIEVN
jgi:hypothetical protein